MKKYPKLTRECNHKTSYLAFIQLKEIKAKEVKDTITAYSDYGLDIWVDIDKKNRPCGIEIIFHKEG